MIFLLSITVFLVRHILNLIFNQKLRLMGVKVQTRRQNSDLAFTSSQKQWPTWVDSLCQIPRSRPFLGIPWVGTGVGTGVLQWPPTHRALRIASSLSSCPILTRQSCLKQCNASSSGQVRASALQVLYSLNPVHFPSFICYHFLSWAPCSNRSSWHSHVTSHPPAFVQRLPTVYNGLTLLSAHWHCTDS